MNETTEGLSRPDLDLLAVIREVGSVDLAARIDQQLGSKIHRDLGCRLRAAGVANPETERENVFQDFLRRVSQRFRNRGADDIAWSAWFYKVAHSALAAFLQKLSSEKKAGRVDLDPAEAEQFSTNMRHASIELDPSVDKILGLVEVSLQKLPERQREAIRLSRLEVSDPEIAEIMGIKEVTVRATRSKGLLRLRNEIEEVLLGQPTTPTGKRGKRRVARREKRPRGSDRRRESDPEQERGPNEGDR